MFWSKIWFFLVAVAAGAAITVALVMPRPPERQRAIDERQRLVVACDVVNILLRDSARARVQLASTFARDESITDVANRASASDKIDSSRYQTARDEITRLLSDTQGARPDFAILLDRHGRVIARVGIDEAEYGDSLAGMFLVDDALDGFMRDDLWALENKLYLVAGAPVVRIGPPVAYAGAIILGHQVDKEMAEQFVKPLSVDIDFFAGGQVVAASTSVSLDNDIKSRFSASEQSDDITEDCRTSEPFELQSGSATYTALTARLPGTAAHDEAFFSIFVERPKAVGFKGTIDAVKKNDLSFGSFPWIPLGGGFLLITLLGIGLMMFETDRPLKKLAADAVNLAKGDVERLDEDHHRGKFGSVARSINIQIDKLARDAKAAKRDLDQLLGPVSDDALGLGASALPSSPSGGGLAFTPPPPSEFKFDDGPKASPSSVPAAPPVSASSFDLDLPDEKKPAAPPIQKTTPPPAVSLPGIKTPSPRTKTPPPIPIPSAKSAPVAVPSAIDDDILAGDDDEAAAATSTAEFEGPTVVADNARVANAAGALAADDEAATFRRVFEEFVALKTQCGESTSTLTYEKFETKLRNNKNQLMSKHGCREVRFQVYVKDGKAALKATPVKD